MHTHPGMILRSRLARLWPMGLGIVLACVAAWSSVDRPALAVDEESKLPLAPHGTPFHFEVIESHDAAYLGDTPAHVGKDGGLTFRPHVSLGDRVYRTIGAKHTTVGRITRVEWSRVSGSLEVEFEPAPLQRIAVGDEVWIDLNPASPASAAAADET